MHRFPVQRDRGPGCWVVALAMSIVCGGGATAAHNGDPRASGHGWSAVRIDVDVHVDPQRRSFTTEGTLTLKLDRLAESNGPLLLLGTQRTRAGEPAIAFDSIESPGASSEILAAPVQGRWQQAWVRFENPRPRGTVIDVHFSCATRGTVRRMIVDETVALADWINAWLPFTLPEPGQQPDLTPNLFRAPGRTTLHLPRGWSGLVDGEQVERRERGDEVVEVWRTTEGVARGFVAGRFDVIRETISGRRIRVYLRDAMTRDAAGALARRLGQAIAALEAELGPWPVPGPYSVVDFPLLPEQSFGAVSEQTYVLVQPPNLCRAESNIQLLAHEVSHAWWGNLIGTTGPGGKWCSESLAQLGALIAIERLEGDVAMRDFLELGREGTDPYYSAAGYFGIVRQGNDLPLATMGQGAGTHALANSKGVWVLHMLRERLGDETFYGVLRAVIDEFAGDDLTAAALRERFVRAAPEQDLTAFFAQWLDRTGAPVLDVDWHATVDGAGMLLELTQLQEGQPFRLTLEVAIDLADGSRVLKALDVSAARQTFEISLPGRPVGLRLDPGRRILLWRPEYGPRPVQEIVAEPAGMPPELIRAVVGRYRFEGMEKNVEVFERDGALYVQPEGASPVRLLHDHDGTFRVDAPGGMLAEFDLSSRPARSFVSIEGGGSERYVARRLEPPPGGPPGTM